MAEILISGIEFYGFHGVPDAERQVGNRFLIDLELTVETNATQTDDIADTVDYGIITQLVIEIGEGLSVKTVERLAQLIGEKVLGNDPKISALTLKLHKLLPPIPATVASVGVRLTLTR